MRELLEKAHQEDQKDALFEEDPEDAEFEAPADVRDVYLEDFADTDEELDDEETEERQLRREERKRAKAKAGFNPLQPKTVRMGQASVQMPSAEELAILGPNIDVSKMAPSTLILEIRRRKREAKREQRSEQRRSNLRASTLKTEADVIERERQEKIEKQNSRKGRKAQHVTGEIRGARPMTQAELIAAALEEEERNKEALTDWLKKEEERRELRRVGRKRVRGPRWTWVSRTVGRLVEVVEDETTAAPTPAARDSTAPAADDRPSETPATDRDADENEAAAEGATAATLTQQQPPPPTAQPGPPSANTGVAPEPAEQPAATDKSGAVDESKKAEDVKSEESAPAPEPRSMDVDSAPAASNDSDAKATEPVVPEASSAVQNSANAEPSTADVTMAESATKINEAPPASSATTSDPVLVDGSKDAVVAPNPPNEEAGNQDEPTITGGPVGQGEATNSDEPSKAEESTKTSEPTPAGESSRVDSSSKLDEAPKVEGSTKADAPAQPGDAGKDAAKDTGADGEKKDEAPTGPYTRNYLILSQVPGGLPAELKLILGDHVDWSDVKVVPARNRPISKCSRDILPP